MHYEVLKIFKHDQDETVSGLYHYLVSWKGYKKKTWVAEPDLNAPMLLAEYWEGRNRSE